MWSRHIRSFSLQVKFFFLLEDRHGNFLFSIVQFTIETWRASTRWRFFWTSQDRKQRGKKLDDKFDLNSRNFYFTFSQCVANCELVLTPIELAQRREVVAIHIELTISIVGSFNLSQNHGENWKSCVVILEDPKKNFLLSFREVNFVSWLGDSLKNLNRFLMIKTQLWLLSKKRNFLDLSMIIVLILRHWISPKTFKRLQLCFDLVSDISHCCVTMNNIQPRSLKFEF